MGYYNNSVGGAEDFDGRRGRRVRLVLDCREVAGEREDHCGCGGNVRGDRDREDTIECRCVCRERRR